MNHPQISVIVLTWNGSKVIRNCLAAVLAQDYPNFEVLVVDNGSQDGTPDLVARQFPQVRLIRNGRNLGFAAGNNVGLQAAAGDILILLNDDTQVHPGWLSALARAFQDPEVGIAGCKLLYPDGTIQHAGGYLSGPRGETEHLGRHEPGETHSEETEPDFVTGAALAISRPALRQIGLLDEAFHPIYYEDTDWCYRARRAGFRVVYVPQAVVTHYESATARPVSYRHKLALNHGRVRFLLKHWPLARLLAEFGPAERAWVVSMARGVELMAARRAYFNAILELPGILAFRAGPPSEAEALLDLLLDLRSAALSGLEALQAPTPPAPAPAEEPSAPAPAPLPQRTTGLGAKLRGLWAGLRYLNALPDLARHIQQHDRVLAQYDRTLARHGRLIGRVSRRVDRQQEILQGQSQDVAENIRELTALAARLAHGEGPAPVAPDKGEP